MFFFFFFCQRRWSTPEVNAGGQRADVALARGDAWGTRGTWGAWERGARETRGIVARGARESAWERVGARGGAWERVAGPLAARGRVSGEPETSGGAWGRVRGQIRPILVSMDRS